MTPKGGTTKSYTRPVTKVILLRKDSTTKSHTRPVTKVILLRKDGTTKSYTRPVTKVILLRSEADFEKMKTLFSDSYQRLHTLTEQVSLF